ncbi:4'-phosphopantetheinyl transferase [Malonomonas rubra DSM 5091]|uniref:4'-phosphopantetheinyl transferase n=1 Tax=Malonomonas rubra DSM 5091 TaxID=1122189 RepID=A0A1M6LI08_MALRU|nr:4'-phosphopantetheinyl transferase superfamily protein [Malonomonas rubra]SHJ70807.1 4'-phosphopantetheinyl transferase [Malonomonas rubra DSM 5091]
MGIAVGCWRTAPERPVVSPDKIDLWRFSLALPEVQTDQLKSLLTDDEIARAGRLLLKEKQQQFICARARIRQILSRYLHCEPSAIAFVYAEQGKPGLRGVAGVDFNLAHSGRWGVLAVGQGQVGVDIEGLDHTLDYHLLAQRYFSSTERTLLEAASLIRQLRIFYRLWTQKEAWLKMQGGGFSSAGQTTGADEFSRHFYLTRGYAAAVTFSAPVAIINKYDFS